MDNPKFGFWLSQMAFYKIKTHLIQTNLKSKQCHLDCVIQLFDKGFMTIDAVDPSSGMLSQAKEKNVYRNLYCDYMTASSKDIFASGKYDTGIKRC